MGGWETLARAFESADLGTSMEFIGNYFSRTCGPLAGIEGGATTGWTTSVEDHPEGRGERRECRNGSCE